MTLDLAVRATEPHVFHSRGSVLSDLASLWAVSSQAPEWIVPSHLFPQDSLNLRRPREREGCLSCLEDSLPACLSLSPYGRTWGGGWGFCVRRALVTAMSSWLPCHFPAVLIVFVVSSFSFLVE